PQGEGFFLGEKFPLTAMHNVFSTVKNTCPQGEGIFSNEKSTESPCNSFFPPIKNSSPAD
ncbi:MAG: hypothetical protein ACLS29_10250, partial [Prevotellamassilia sp.]